MSSFVRYAIVKESNHTLHKLALNSEINGLIELCEKVRKEELNKRGSM